MSELLYEVDKYGCITFDIMSTGVHEHFTWSWEEQTDVRTIEPVKEMIADLNRICRPSFTGNRWTFIGMPDYSEDKQWLGAEDAQKRKQLVRMRFEFWDAKSVPLFKLTWHGR